MIYAMTIYMEIPSNRYVSRYERHLQFEKCTFLLRDSENLRTFAADLRIDTCSHPQWK